MTRTAALELVQKVIYDELAMTSLDPYTSLDDLDLDSLEVASLLQAIENAAGFEIQTPNMMKMTVDQLVNLLVTHPDPQ